MIEQKSIPLPARFNNDQLQMLEDALEPRVRSWAVSHPYVRESGPDHRLIRDMATVHALGEALLARGRLLAFRDACSQNLDMHTLTPALQGKAPKEMAGTAAGHLAVAKLLSGWYDLSKTDFDRLLLSRKFPEIPELEEEGVQEAVCVMPRVLGITTFTSRDVFLPVMFAVETTVGKYGPTGLLDPYISFPEFPIT